MIRRFQNRIATSRIALPFMVIYSLVIWAAYLAADITLWPCLIFYVISTYLMIELNNRNALIRQYSRMVSCSYMSMMLMSPWLIHNVEAMAFQTFIIMVFTLLFISYQNRADVGHKFWAYLFFGLASVIWPPVLYFLPLFWIGEASYLMSFSIKSFWASLFAILTPFWIALPICIFTDNYDLAFRMNEYLVPSDNMLTMFNDITTYFKADIDIKRLSPTILILVVMIISVIHYLRQSYADKIQVRMLYHFFMLIALIASLAIILYHIVPFQLLPAVDMLLCIVIVCTAPLVAHYIAFTNTRITNISVIILMIISFAISISQALLPLLITT